METDKRALKIRLLAYFPYGFCSLLATTLGGLTNKYARILRLGDDPSKTIQDCEKAKRRHTDRIKYLINKAFADERTWKCGTPATKRNYRVLTKKGLAFVTEFPLDIIAKTEDDELVAKNHSRKIKERTGRRITKAEKNLQELLDAYSDDTDDYDQQMFNDILLESVMDGLAIPLAQAFPVAADVKISISKYSQNQLYNIWRISHINAMFRLIYSLTYLDRRHYDTGYAIDGIRDDASYQAYINKHGHTVASATYYALTKWYQENPGYYQIIQRHPDESKEAIAAWLEVPAFYLATELPNMERGTETDSVTKLHGSLQKFKSVFVGLAAGKKQNYICYHGTLGEFKWIQKKEINTRKLVEESIREMKTQNPAIRYNDKVDYGLIFCLSYHQFLAIFDRVKECHKKNKKGEYPTKKPFVSLHAIPVNDCGCYLLWHLMEASPGETEMTFCKRLVAEDPNFDHQTNLYYPLTYNGVNVFVGHTMDIKKINHVLEDYLDGKKFFLVCFPEQVKWYRQLFPEITIL